MELSDGGVETFLLFQDGFELPCFAAFPLLDDERGRTALRAYFAPFFDIAARHGLPFVLDTVTWRANPEWAARLGRDVAAANTAAVEFARSIAPDDAVINGVVGPRGDGYTVDERMTADAASDYHGVQIGVLREAGVDRITALTLTYPDEAIGIVRAAAGVPVAIGFTVETDGRLPDGTAISDAIAAVDAATDGAAEFFLINCAHPTHIARGLDGRPELTRIGGLRVNGSPLSHAELDAAETLDDSDPVALAGDHLSLRDALPGVRLLGGCCGTDHRHVAEIVDAWTTEPKEAP
jgi:homocysteine S-methyltransferase